MKTLVLTVPARIELTPAMIRQAFGPKVMSAAKRALEDENRTDLARLARQSSVASLSGAVRTVTKAITRYESAKGTRDERHALAHLEAACIGLRSAERNLKKLVAVTGNSETTEEKEN